MGWSPVEQSHAPRGASAFRITPEEADAWARFAAAILSNISDRTMPPEVAAEKAATHADAMIMERRARLFEAPVPVAPRVAPAPAAVAPVAVSPAPAAPVAAPHVASGAVPAPGAAIPPGGFVQIHASPDAEATTPSDAPTPATPGAGGL